MDDQQQDQWKPSSAQEIWLPPSAKPVESPKPTTEEPSKQEDEPWYSKVWHAGNTPLSTIPGTIYKSALPFVTGGALNPKDNPDIANAGADFANSLTSPINLGMGLLTGGESLAGRAGLTGLEAGLKTASNVASLPFMAEGIHDIGSGHPLSGTIEALSAVPGLTGLTSDALKFIRPPDYVPKIRPSEVVPDWLSSSKQTELARLNVEVPKEIPSEPTTLLEAQQQGEQQFAHHTPDAISQHVDSIPAIASGDAIKPSPDIINSQPVEPAVPSDIVIPRAGQARPTPDINALTANIGSADQVLANHPSTKEIPETIIPAYDKMSMFVKDELNQVGQFTQGLNKESRLVVDGLLRGNDIPSTPTELNAFQGIRSILDNIHSMYPDVVQAKAEAAAKNEKFDPKSFGYLENYLNEMRAQDTGPLATIRRYFLGDKIEPTEPGTFGDLREQGLGDPSSPFIKKRTGAIPDIEHEINRTLPAYISAAGREIFLRPAVEKATEVYKNLPNNSVMKELSKYYINNVSNYDSEPALHRAFNTFASRMANITARSFLDWKFGLHSLHAAELGTSIFPELGANYTSRGLTQLLTSPKDSLAELGRAGLIQGEYTPPAFRTLGDRYQSVANFLNLAEKLAKGTAYFGAKQKYLDMGMDTNTAMMKAIKDAKQYTYTVDPARSAKIFSPESNVMGGEVVSKLGGQFKSVPLKIIEQYKNIIGNIKNDPSKAARLIQGNAIAIALAQAGMHTFHVDPTSLLSGGLFGAFGSAVGQIGSDLAKLDMPSALVHTVEWATPGGQTIKTLIK